MNTLFAVPLTIIIILLSGCDKYTDEIKRLSDQYSIEELNYFYEIGFHSEGDSNKVQPICKWDKNINIFIDGDMFPDNRAGVINAVNEVNNLDLPLKMQITDDKEISNMHVYFGDRQRLGLEAPVSGKGVFTATNHVIEYAEVKILNEANETIAGQKERNKIILEEITQVLGIIGDSYTYPHSVFYEKPNNVAHLSTIDKKMLQLLYDPALPVGYKCEQFEKDFAAQLHHVNKEEKLLKHVKQNGISKKNLQHILQYGLAKKKNNVQRIAKFNQPIQVYAKGDTATEHKPLIIKAIKELNKVSKQIDLRLTPSNSLLHSGGIIYTFSRNEELTHPLGVQVSVTVSENLLLDKRYRADIEISFKDTATVNENMPLAVANAMYQAISLINESPPEFFSLKGDSLILKPEYEEILRLYYTNSMAENLTKEEIQRVIDRIQE